MTCNANVSTVQLSGSLTNGTAGQVTWVTDCPEATFGDVESLQSTLSFRAVDTNQSAVTCQVVLTVNGQSCSSARIGASVCINDCKGVPNGSASFDRCGVCNGDGNSCLDCKTTSTKDVLFALDGFSASQHLITAQAAKIALKSAGKKDKTSIRQILSLSNITHNAQWTSVWSKFPPVITNCSNTSLCVTENRTGLIQEYRARAQTLRNFTSKILATMEGNRALKKKVVALNREASNLLEEALEAVNTFPATSSVCG